MGVIRVLLAISVLAIHTGSVFGLTFVSGELAVQAFYLISGFYMALILTEKYQQLDKPYYYFITNRLIKLFPLYWTVLLLTFFLGMIALYTVKSNFIFKEYFQHADILGIQHYLLIGIANVILIGQDWLFFIGFDKASGDFLFTLNYPESNQIRSHHFLLVGQAWTISLELTFYFIAPFLNQLSERRLFYCFCILLIVRVIFYYFGFSDRPWSYQFFPFELSIFIAGMISFRLYKAYGYFIKELVENHRFVPYILLGFVILITLFYDRLNLILPFHVLYLVLIFISLPFIFYATKKSELDRKIGELSYPIYMGHLLIAYVIANMISSSSFYFGILVLITTLIFSYIFNSTIQRYIERVRITRIKYYL